MTSIPRPPEPSTEDLRDYGKSYDEGVSDFLDTEKPLKDEVVGKQAVIHYLWDRWKPYDVEYQEVQKACGDASWAIEQWIEGEYSWGEVLGHIEQSLGANIE